MALPVILVFNTINDNPKFSPIDELPHFDYAERIYSDGVPAMGDMILNSSAKVASCYGLELEDFYLPACGSEVTASDLPGYGYQYQAQHPPFYYLLVKPLAALIGTLGIGQLGAFRIPGALFLVLGLLILMQAALLLRINRFVALGIVGVLGSAPVVVYQASIVSNDTLVIFLASTACYLFARQLAHRPVKLRWFLCWGAISALTKSNLIVVCFAVGLLLILQSRKEDYSPFAHPIMTLRKSFAARGGVVLIVSSLATSALWNLSVKSRAYVELRTFPSLDVLRLNDVSLPLIFRESLIAFSPLTSSYTPFNGMNLDVMAIVAQLLTFAVIAACAATFFNSETHWFTSAGPVAMTTQYLGSVFIGIGMWITFDQDPGVQGRLTMAMTPLFLLILFAGIRTIRGFVVLLSSSLVITLVFALNILLSKQ